MKKRYLYILLCLLPGALFALIAAALVTAATAGVLWIFLFGDHSWPAYAEKGLTVVMVATFLVTWLAILGFGFVTGRRLEAQLGVNRKHLWASAALTLLPLLIIVMHQLSVGNLGPPHDSTLCRGYCLEQGYSASGMPPQDSGEDRCFCLNEEGVEVLTVPMYVLRPSR
jgi:hypothetical protein